MIYKAPKNDKNNSLLENKKKGCSEHCLNCHLKKAMDKNKIGGGW